MAQEVAGPSTPCPWQRDVVTGHRDMTTTGGSTWDAAHRLCDFLEAEWPAIWQGRSVSSSSSAAPRIVEVGSGTGWLGMTLARNLASGAAPGIVCLTEQAGGGAMEWLQDNLAENVSAGVPLGAVSLQELDWSAWEDDGAAHAVPIPAASPDGGDARWDLLIGSDLIYGEAGVRLLPKVLGEFATQFPDLVILYCHTLHRFDDFDLEFCRALRREGLEYRVVAVDGAARPEDAGDELDPLADDCAGFLEELFPEQRIVVFHIRAAGANCFLPWSSSLARPKSSALHPEDGSERRDSAEVQQAATPAVDAGAGIVKVGRVHVLLPVEGQEDGGDSRASGLPGDAVVVRLVNLGPFGSGEHPTTALMLRALQDRQWDESMSVCDYGCGSGLLGLLALALGAGYSLGVDNVPDALCAAQQNLEANPWAGPVSGSSEPRLRLHLPPAETLDKDLDFYARHGDWRTAEGLKGWTPLPVQDAAFDLVVANIVVGPLCRSAAVVRQLLRPGGEVLLSGMREFQVEQVQAAYGEHFELRVMESLKGWGLVHGRLKETAP